MVCYGKTMNLFAILMFTVVTHTYFYDFKIGCFKRYVRDNPVRSAYTIRPYLDRDRTNRKPNKNFIFYSGENPQSE